MTYSRGFRLEYHQEKSVIHGRHRGSPRGSSRILYYNTTPLPSCAECMQLQRELPIDRHSELEYEAFSTEINLHDRPTFDLFLLLLSLTKLADEQDVPDEVVSQSVRPGRLRAFGRSVDPR